MSIRLLCKIYRVNFDHSFPPCTSDLVNARYISRPCESNVDAAIPVIAMFNHLFCFFKTKMEFSARLYF